MPKKQEIQHDRKFYLLFLIMNKCTSECVHNLTWIHCRRALANKGAVSTLKDSNPLTQRLGGGSGASSLVAAGYLFATLFFVQ